MKTLNVETRLECARAAVAVLRALRISNNKMRYGEFAKAIGMMGESEPWEVWHRNQITDILNLVGATERQAGSAFDMEPLEFERVVTADGVLAGFQP